MDPAIPDLPFAANMFADMLICPEIGRRLGMRSLAKDPQGAMSGLGVMQGAVFSLYGLLIAFTFSGAPARDSRLQAFRKLPDYKAAMAELAKSEKLQMNIWTEAVDAFLPGSNSGADKLLLPALNDTIDITSTRTMSMRIHPPLVIFALLFFLALVCSLLAGYGMAASKHRSRLHITAFSAVAVISVFVILEIEYPRTGFFHLETAYDQVLADVRGSMK